MILTPGSRWRSSVCTAEVIVVRAPTEPAELRCGGHPMVPIGAGPPAGLAAAPERSDGSLLGKRYTDETTHLEVLCAKGGMGSLCLDGRPLALKEAKPLPSSD